MNDKETRKSEEKESLTKIEIQKLKNDIKKRGWYDNLVKRIEQICEDLSLQNKHQIIAKGIFDQLCVKMIKKIKSMRNREREVFIASCVHIACRLESTSRSFKEISSELNIDKKKLGKTVKEIKILLNLKFDLISYKEFIYRYCEELKVSDEILNLAIQICEISKKLEGMSQNQSFVVGASILLALKLQGQYYSILDIVNVCSISENGIRNTIRIFEKSEIFEEFKDELKKLKEIKSESFDF